LDTFNKYMVGMAHNGLVIMNPPRTVMSTEEALVLAAWIVSMADPLGEKFAEALTAVQKGD
jgi:hypothetical protein